METRCTERILASKGIPITMICPDCSANTIKITQSLELPPDDANDEIALQTIHCEVCGFRALAVYRESRRGAVDSESWIHEGFRVSEEDFQMVKEVIGACPNPSDKRCQCAAHNKFGQQNASHWNGLAQMGITIQHVFNL